MGKGILLISSSEMGLMHITGARDGPPVKVGVAVTDLTTGLYTSNAILAALIQRGRTGKGQHIDAALSDCQVATLSNLASSSLISGQRDSGRWGTAHPSIVPYKSFATVDGHILLGGGNDRLFRILCQRLGKPEWPTDVRFITNSERVKHRDILEGLIERETRRKTTGEWLGILEGCGLPYAAVNDIKDTLEHEHVLARGMVREVQHAGCGRLKVVGSPVKYSEFELDGKVWRAPPMLGEHTQEVLQGMLGMDEREIQELMSRGVIA